MSLWEQHMHPEEKPNTSQMPHICIYWCQNKPFCSKWVALHQSVDDGENLDSLSFKIENRKSSSLMVNKYRISSVFWLQIFIFGISTQAVSTSQRECTDWEPSPKSHVEFHQEAIAANIRCVWSGLVQLTPLMCVWRINARNLLKLSSCVCGLPHFWICYRFKKIQWDKWENFRAEVCVCVSSHQI